MNYLEAWQKGFKDAKEFTIEQINEHCGTSFSNLVDVVLYIKEAQLAKKQGVENVEG
jgi:hypothetical protein